MKNYIDFLLTLHKNVDKGLYICLSTKKRNRWKDYFFKTPLHEEELENFFIDNDTNRYDLYFCPHPFKEPRRLKSSAVATNYLWSDLDYANPNNVEPKPAIAWESSPNRFCGLWVQKEKPSLGETEKRNQYIAKNNGGDPSGWDITQVLRIPGTRNHKYDDCPRGKMLWCDFTPKDYDFNESSSEVADICRKYGIGRFTMKKLFDTEPTQGKRSEVMWKLECRLAEMGLNAEEIMIVLKDSPWNKFLKREAQLKREVEKAIEHTGGNKSKREKDTPIKILDLDLIQPEVIEWLWYPMIPFGKLTIIEGDPGLGKSWLTMALASYVSLGKKLPNQIDAQQGDVLIMSAEDGAADTLVPRLLTLGANLKHIKCIQEAVSFTEEGYKKIMESIEYLNPKLIIIDPLVAYLGGKVDLHKANETREVMYRLAKMAEEKHAAVVCVRHLTKGGGDGRKAIYRGIGSIDLTAAARSVIAIGRNPEDPNDERVMCHIKCNLARLGKPIAYRLSGDKKEPFEFIGEVNADVTAVLNQEPVNTIGPVAEACEWLKTFLQESRTRAEVEREAEARGISLEILRRAKKDLKVGTIKLRGEIRWTLA